MAAGKLSRPGTEFGPCKNGCEHTDCAETRRMSETECWLCCNPIGYDTYYYRDQQGLVHALYYEKEIGR